MVRVGRCVCVCVRAVGPVQQTLVVLPLSRAQCLVTELRVPLFGCFLDLQAHIQS